MTPRQKIAYDNPLFSLFQITANLLYREDKQLPTGIYFSTYLTLDAFEQPFSWHAAVGFITCLTLKGNDPGAAIPVEKWDDQMKVLAMNAAAELLRGVGRTDGGEHWDKAEIHALSFQAWRRLSLDESLVVARRRDEEASAVRVFPIEWEPLQRSLKLGNGH
jgi:hypothetical protein